MKPSRLYVASTILSLQTPPLRKCWIKNSLKSDSRAQDEAEHVAPRTRGVGLSGHVHTSGSKAQRTTPQWRWQLSRESDCPFLWPPPPHWPLHRDGLAIRQSPGHDSQADSARMGTLQILLSNPLASFHGWLTPLLTHSFLLCCQDIQAARSSLAGWEPFWIFRQVGMSLL